MMDVLRPYTFYIVIALAAVVLLQFVFLIALNARLGRTAKMVRSLMTGPEGADLEQMLRNYIGRVEAVEAQHGAFEASISSLSAQLKGCVQNVGLVRFDAFGDVSGGQSFSIALLDSLGNGVIVTGLFGRSDSRCFGKSIWLGTPEQALSQEEEQALEIAMGRAPAQSNTAEEAPRGRRRRATAS